MDTEQANPVNRFRLYQEAKKIVEARIVFMVHAGVYLAVNGLLILINISTAGRDGYWCQWPALLWGAGLLLHGCFVLLTTHKNMRRWQQTGAGRKTTEMLIGLTFHWSLFLIINVLLIAINVLMFEGNRHEGFWSLWIVLGWGIGIGFHTVWVYLNKDHKLKRWKRQKALKILDSWGGLS